MHYAPALVVCPARCLHPHGSQSISGCVASFFVTCASKPLSGTGHSKTNGAIARRNLSCTKGVDGVTQGNLQCTAEPRVEVSAGQQNVKSQCQASRSWQLMERQGSSPSTAGAPPQRTTCHQDCTSPGKEVCPVRPEKPARLRGSATVHTGSAEGDPRDISDESMSPRRTACHHRPVQLAASQPSVLQSTTSVGCTTASM